MVKGTVEIGTAAVAESRERKFRMINFNFAPY